MIAVNHHDYNNMFFVLFLLIWFIVTLVSLMIFSYFINALFKGFKNIFLLITMYTLCYIVFNIAVAAIDPNKVGTFVNLLSFCTRIEWLRFNTLPFLASIGIIMLFHRLKKEDYA